MSAASVFETASSSSGQKQTGKFEPPVPQKIDDLGISKNVLVDIMLKMIMLEGECSLSKIAARLKVHIAVANQIFTHLRKEQFVEVKGMVGNDYSLTLSGPGRRVAQDRYSISQYVGPAPVPLDYLR